MPLIANKSAGNAVTDLMWNEIVNRLNGLAPNTAGIAKFLSSGATTWTVPEGITTETRIRVWYVGGGGTGDPGAESFGATYGGNARWGYKVLTGFSGGQNVPITVGAAGAATNFNSGQLISGAGGNSSGGVNGSQGSVSGEDFITSPKVIGRGEGGYATTGAAGAVIIEW